MGQPFEEVLGEIDKEIGKCDSKRYEATTSEASMGKESHVSSDVSMGKESHVGQPNIKEAKVPRISSMPAQLEPCIPPMPTQLSLSPRVHGAEIPNPFVSHGHAEGTWKRITRVGLAADSSQPKKRRVYQGGATKNKILAEVDNQSCQKL